MESEPVSQAIVVYRPFDVRGGNVFQLKSRASTVRSVTGEHHRVVIEQKQGISVGAVLWDAALVLGSYFQNENAISSSFFQGKRVLEVGSGTGYLSIVTGLLGARETIATDLDGPLLQLITDNVTAAEERCQQPLNVTVKPLRWGLDELESWSIEDSDVDLVIGSDVVYAEYAFQALVETLTELARRNAYKERFEIILSYKKRYVKELKFFRSLKRAGFTWTTVPAEHLQYDIPDTFVYRIRWCPDADRSDQVAEVGRNDM